MTWRQFVTPGKHLVKNNKNLDHEDLYFWQAGSVVKFKSHKDILQCLELLNHQAEVFKF